MSQVKIAAIWKFDKKEVESKFNSTIGRIVCIISECGNYWFGSAEAGADQFADAVGRTYNSLSLCHIDDPQSDVWEVVRQAILNDKIDPPTEGRNPYSKRREEECSTCKRMKDVNSNCWWCGNK